MLTICRVGKRFPGISSEARDAGLPVPGFTALFNDDTIRDFLKKSDDRFAHILLLLRFSSSKRRTPSSILAHQCHINDT